MSEISEGHTVKGYDVDLAGPADQAARDGRAGARPGAARGARARRARTRKLRARVLAREQEVNAYDLRIDEDSVALIARRQPMGSDLRAIISIARAVTDLERIGDEAKKIAHAVLRGDGPSAAHAPSPQLARDARHMARFALPDAARCARRLRSHGSRRGRRGRAPRRRSSTRSSRRRCAGWSTQVMEDPRRLAADARRRHRAQGARARRRSRQEHRAPRALPGRGPRRAPRRHGRARCPVDVESSRASDRRVARSRRRCSRRSISRSSSLIEVLARVRASTRLTITAQCETVAAVGRRQAAWHDDRARGHAPIGHLSRWRDRRCACSGR